MVQLASLYRNSLKSYEASKINESESEKKKKEFPPIPASFHHSVYFAAGSFVGTLFVLLSDFLSVCLSDCLSLCLPVCLSYVFLKELQRLHETTICSQCHFCCFQMRPCTPLRSYVCSLLHSFARSCICSLSRSLTPELVKK